jgi:hypothetical protein
MWKTIDTAPKDGSFIVCWQSTWDRPFVLHWKTNQRIVDHHKEFPDDPLKESYFGDPERWDDYDLAHYEDAATHWHPLADLPKS